MFAASVSQTPGMLEENGACFWLAMNFGEKSVDVQIRTASAAVLWNCDFFVGNYRYAGDKQPTIKTDSWG